jgi:hypothetical protein
MESNGSIALWLHYNSIMIIMINMISMITEVQ